VRGLLPLLLLVAAPAAAHDRSTSYSTWDIQGRRAHVVARTTALEATHYPWGVGTDRAAFERTLGEYLTTRLRLFAGETPCGVVDGPRPLDVAPGQLSVEWTLACPDTGGLTIKDDLFFDVAPMHLHIAHVTIDGGVPEERVLTASERTWTLSAGAGLEGTSLPGYVRLGIEHILTGYDHLAFLLALLLLGGTLGEVAGVVTGFTVAHSITLGLAVLGRIHPERAAIEALIGLSIALVAAENVWLVGARGPLVPVVVSGGLVLLALVAAAGHGAVPALTLAGLALFTVCYFGLLRRVARTARLRWAIAFLFGLVHGCGFAAVLIEAHVAATRLVHALLGFNLGVELGQLGVVALLWPVLVWITRGDGRRRALVVEAGSAAVLALGLFWFVSRAYGTS
jgi:HupE / UreJ protein